MCIMSKKNPGFQGKVQMYLQQTEKQNLGRKPGMMILQIKSKNKLDYANFGSHTAGVFGDNVGISFLISL